MLGRVRAEKEALAEIEGRTERDASCPHCKQHCERQKWGRTRTGVQRFRCGNCRKTYSGLTGTGICGLHRPDLFLEVIRDMMSEVPSSCRKLAERLGINPETVWRWRIRILAMLSEALHLALSGIVEVDETYQRESRKGSREWVRHRRDPACWPAPPRPRWRDFGATGMKMMRGLPRWQLPLLTVVDRSGARRLVRLPDTKHATTDAALSSLLARDVVLCSNGAAPYAAFSQALGIEHFVVGSKPGTRLASPSHHIQNVNSLHARYGDFIRMFRGPATRYLDGYLRWFVARAGQIRPDQVFAAAL